jgi:hypothetical protein
MMMKPSKTALAVLAAVSVFTGVETYRSATAQTPPGLPFVGGGPMQMVVSGNNLFILRGNTLYRVNAATLRVEAQGDLPNAITVAPGNPANPANSGTVPPLPPPPGTTPGEPSPGTQPGEPIAP